MYFIYVWDMVGIYIPVIYNYIGNYNFTSKIITFYKSIFSILRRITSTQKKIPIQYSHFHYYFSTNYTTNSINKYCKHYMSNIKKPVISHQSWGSPKTELITPLSNCVICITIYKTSIIAFEDESPKTLTTAALITTFTHFLPKTNIVQIVCMYVCMYKHSHAYP